MLRNLGNNHIGWTRGSHTRSKQADGKNAFLTTGDGMLVSCTLVDSLISPLIIAPYLHLITVNKHRLRLTHLSPMEFPTIIIWASPFLF